MSRLERPRQKRRAKEEDVRMNVPMSTTRAQRELSGFRAAFGEARARRGNKVRRSRKRCAVGEFAHQPSAARFISNHLRLAESTVSEMALAYASRASLGLPRRAKRYA